MKPIHSNIHTHILIRKKVFTRNRKGFFAKYIIGSGGCLSGTLETMVII